MTQNIHMPSLDFLSNFFIWDLGCSGNEMSLVVKGCTSIIFAGKIQERGILAVMQTNH